jgi:hypothetical protein
MELIEGRLSEAVVHRGRAALKAVDKTIDRRNKTPLHWPQRQTAGLSSGDRKPPNLMLFSPEGEKAHVPNNNTKLLVKISDFGLAQAIMRQLVRCSRSQGDFVGTTSHSLVRPI